MSKAEETARHYLLNEHKSPLNQILHQADLKTELQYHTDIENACKYGYHQAEKDLELGWEDIEKIVDLYDDVYYDFSIDGNGGKINAEEHYTEVLKRFKNMKDGGKE